MTGVLLVEDHTSFRQALAFLFEHEADFTVVGQAGTLAEARELLRSIDRPVDLALIDLDLPDGSGVDLVRPIRAAHATSAVLVLTATRDRAVFARAVEGGVAGIMHKSAPIHEIIDAARRLGAGELLLSPGEVIELLQLAAQQRERNHDAELALQSLTSRERDVLAVLAEGLNDKQIAQRLQISPETQRTHMVNILRKLGVDSRLQALVFAMRHGVVEIR